MTDRIQSSFELWAQKQGFTDLTMNMGRYNRAVVRWMWAAWLEQSERITDMAAALDRSHKRSSDLLKQCRDHDGRRATAHALAATLAAEVDRLNETIAKLAAEGQDAHEMRGESMNIEELKRLAEAATPGPWFAAISSNMNNSVHVSMGTICDTGKNIDDAAFIAAANPAAILELIQQRDELLAALKDARELVDDWGAYATAYMQEKHGLAEDLERLDAAISKVEEQS